MSAIPASPAAWFERQARWHWLEIAFWLATLLPYVFLDSYLSLEIGRAHV